ncbi:MAG: extracellular solute-binding protein [Caldilineaceae bacterium]|nr:extracellular solute-binding protein [Caldilineaceae bacterium]MBP8106905.1 extracellular solute-binding protein [Caldilineaceae bacterium]MBP8121825.1 extracellular solute-binding protein [Caldilineaceae bacterium]MBP9072125.1 extracellular solute-binding protein [Caldilineaceae bacterium]
MRKFSFGLTLLLVLALVLSACGGAAPAAPAAVDSSAAADTAAVEPTVDPNAPTPVPTPVINNFGECADPLILWHGLTGSDGAVFAELLQQYSAANPDTCLNSEGYPWDIFFQKYPTAVAAGSPPDMVIFHAAEVNQMAAEGLMMPLDALIFDDGTLSKDSFNEVLMEQVTVDGQTYAVPFDNHGWLLWYNAKMLEDAGFDSDVLPANGAEFIELAQKLTTDVNGLHPTDADFDKDNVDVWAMEFTWPRYTIPSTMWQFGGEVVSADGKTATLNSAESVAAVQYWHDMMYKYYVAPPAVPGKMWAGDLYKAHRLVFMWEGTWTGGFMRDNPDIAAETKTAFINSLAPDGHQAVKFDSHIMSVPTGVDEDGAAKAKKLMAFLVENGAFWANSGQVPALKSVQALPEVQAIPSVAMAAEQFNAIGRTDTSSKYFIEIQTAWETAVGNALASADADVAALLTAGNEQIQAILDRP